MADTVAQQKAALDAALAKPKVAAKPAKEHPFALKGERTAYPWREAEEQAKLGKMPQAPDFSAATHTRFRPALIEVTTMANNGDVDGLKRFAPKGFIGSSLKAVLRYRDICILALTNSA